jgi:ABC-type sugar transport system substrate-binding protein
MKNYPDIKILDAKHGNWNRDDAFKVMQDYLTRFKHIDAVWTGGDDMSVGVLKAIDQAKRDDIKIVLGGAGSKGMIKTLSDGSNPLIQANVTLFAKDDLRRSQNDRRGAAQGAKVAGQDTDSLCPDYERKRGRVLLS